MEAPFRCTPANGTPVSQAGQQSCASLHSWSVMSDLCLLLDLPAFPTAAPWSRTMPCSLDDSDKSATGLSGASFVPFSQLSSPGLQEGLLNPRSAPHTPTWNTHSTAFRTKVDLLCRTRLPASPSRPLPQFLNPNLPPHSLLGMLRATWARALDWPTHTSVPPSTTA